MDIKVKKTNKDGIVRLETQGKVKEILIEEDFKNETIQICFKGKSSSGIIEMTTKEFEEISKIINKNSNLIKGMRTFKVEKGSL